METLEQNARELARKTLGDKYGAQGLLFSPGPMSLRCGGGVGGGRASGSEYDW